MNDLNFDIYAMVDPKTQADVNTLLAEGLSLIKELNQMLDDILLDRPTPGN